MSLAVEQTLPSREFEVDRPRSSRTPRHAAESLKTNSTPSVASARQEQDALATSASLSERSSYHSSMRTQFYDAMDDQTIIPSQSEHHVEDDQAPVLPQKSALRASRLLENLVSLKMEASAEQLSTFSSHEPHDEYLSSEEEASSTAGDFSDFEYDSSSDDVAQSPVKETGSGEVTARVVSVIFSGKPVVIDVPHVRRSISPSSMERPKSATALLQKPACDSIEDVKRRRVSVSAMSARSCSRESTLLPRVPHPPRSSSMLPLGTGNPKPFFLQIDPYANGSTYSLDTRRHSRQEQVLSHQQQELSQQSPLFQEPQELSHSSESSPVEEERPKTPRTPGKMFKGVARAMSLMKRKSVPRLNQTYLASPSSEWLPRAGSPSSRSIPEEPTEERTAEPSSPEQVVEAQADKALTTPPLPTRAPPRPQLQPVPQADDLRVPKSDRAIRHLSTSRTFHEGQTPESLMSPISPLVAASPSTPGKRMSSFGFGRRRMSVKLTGGKFQF